MRIKQFFSAAMAVVVMASCQSEVITGGSENGKKTTATIELTQGSTTKAAPVNFQVATPEESKISTAVLFVFNAARVLETVVTMDVASGSATKTFETTSGNHYFYAAVNYPQAKIIDAFGLATGSELSAIPAGMTMTDFEKKIVAVTTPATIAEISTADSFWMTNTVRPYAIDLEAGVTDPVGTGKNNISIQVGRVAAKVGFEFTARANDTDQPDGRLAVSGYRVKTMPRNFYFMPVIESGILKTPFWADGATLDATVIDSRYFNTTSDDAKFTLTPQYTVENSNELPRFGNTSYVAIRGVYTPTKWLDASGAEIAAQAPGTTFYRLIDDATKEYLPGYYAAVPSSIPVGKSSVEYLNGVTYYMLPLANNVQTNVQKKYSVKRNSYFWVNITSVAGAGSNTEEGVITDPEEPIENPTMIKATIEVIDWEPVEQNGGI